LPSAASSAPSKSGPAARTPPREFYEKPTAERKRKLAAAVKRHHKRLRSQTLPRRCTKQHPEYTLPNATRYALRERVAFVLLVCPHHARRRHARTGRRQE
jgi:hypothetical protein